MTDTLSDLRRAASSLGTARHRLLGVTGRTLAETEAIQQAVTAMARGADLLLSAGATLDNAGHLERAARAAEPRERGALFDELGRALGSWRSDTLPPLALVEDRTPAQLAADGDDEAGQRARGAW